MSNRKAKTPVELASDFVTESLDSAKAAFAGENSAAAKDGIEAINKSAKAYQARFSDLQTKGMEFAEANANAVLAFWREASAVKSPEALIALQQNFFKAQSQAVVEQIHELNSVGVALVRDVAAPVQESLSKFPGFAVNKAA